MGNNFYGIIVGPKITIDCHDYTSIKRVLILILSFHSEYKQHREERVRYLLEYYRNDNKSKLGSNSLCKGEKWGKRVREEEEKRRLSRSFFVELFCAFFN